MIPGLVDGDVNLVVFRDILVGNDPGGAAEQDVVGRDGVVPVHGGDSDSQRSGVEDVGDSSEDGLDLRVGHHLSLDQKVRQSVSSRSNSSFSLAISPGAATWSVDPL